MHITYKAQFMQVVLSFCLLSVSVLYTVYFAAVFVLSCPFLSCVHGSRLELSTSFVCDARLPRLYTCSKFQCSS